MAEYHGNLIFKKGHSQNIFDATFCFNHSSFRHFVQEVNEIRYLRMDTKFHGRRSFWNIKSHLTQVPVYHVFIII